jgi:hypothetical protein
MLPLDMVRGGRLVGAGRTGVVTCPEWIPRMAPWPLLRQGACPATILRCGWHASNAVGFGCTIQLEIAQLQLKAWKRAQSVPVVFFKRRMPTDPEEPKLRHFLDELHGGHAPIVIKIKAL